ncbi:MAG: hypothetical protein AAF387_21470 [Pseudomonadota bacterium]
MGFEFEERHLKQYPHFDQLISKEALTELVMSPERVTSHKFWPFIEYTKTNRRFRHPDHPPPKSRTIRYAARTDAGIYIFYRYLLAQSYEQRLALTGIDHVPTAYRRLPKAGEGSPGKCNIDFAHDAFSEIRSMKNCVVVTLDISSYFDCIDHSRLRRVWADLLGESNLPEDHYRVFKAITAYTSVDCSSLYRRLGIIDYKPGRNGTARLGFTIPPHQMPRQLCTPREFRELVAGETGEYDRLISAPNHSHGIPQGAPLSDLLANAYLLDFDTAITGYVEDRGGRVWRYSDDIIIVLPGDEKVGLAAKEFAIREIVRYGPKLKIKDEKTAIGLFTSAISGNLEYEWLDGKQGKNGLEYLGFRFDGKRVYLRDSTLTNFQRKITNYAKVEAYCYLKRFRGKTQDWMTKRFQKYMPEFENAFGRVTEFETKTSKKDWTFWTYVTRSVSTFEDFDCRIFAQVRGYRSKVRRVFESVLEKQLGTSG